MIEKESHGGELLMEIESLRLFHPHPHPQVLHLILIVYGEVEKGEVNSISGNPSLMS